MNYLRQLYSMTTNIYADIILQSSRFISRVGSLMEGTLLLNAIPVKLPMEIFVYNVGADTPYL